VERNVQYKWVMAAAPPIEHGTILRPGACIIFAPGESELDVCTRLLANHIEKIADQAVALVAIAVPSAVPFVTVGIDVRDDPPLVVGGERVGVW
jgi:hypothetical protein